MFPLNRFPFWYRFLEPRPNGCEFFSEPTPRFVALLWETQTPNKTTEAILGRTPKRRYTQRRAHLPLRLACDNCQAPLEAAEPTRPAARNSLSRCRCVFSCGELNYQPWAHRLHLPMHVSIYIYICIYLSYHIYVYNYLYIHVYMGFDQKSLTQR